MLRRDMQLYKRGLLPALVLALVLLCFCVAAARSLSGGAVDFKKAQVALVDEENSVLSGVTINLISGQSFTSSVMDITKTEKSEAVSGLEEGRYTAVVVLPDGFVDATSGGKSMSGEILLSDSAQGYSDIVASLAKFGQRLIATGQFGIFSGEMAVIDKYGRGAEHAEYLSKVNILYLNEVLGASEKYFTPERTDYRGSSMTLEGWYTLCYIMLFAGLCPLLFSHMYSADLRTGLYRRLYSMGVRPASFT
ncbi:MAG: ABC transporter permease [Oscillospiraceae bacterium]|nr:ABC transporter permease [Oscillospiraceae bacterium]